MRTYQVEEYYNCNDIFLDVVVFEICAANKEDAMEQAAGMTPGVVIENGKILIEHPNGELFTLLDNDRQKYQFQICTKNITPIDLSTLSKEAKNALKYDQNYYTNIEDYKNVEWTISEAYSVLRELYPERERYIFDSLAYGVTEVI